MLKTHSFEGLVQKLCAVLPASIQNVEHDIQQQFKDILHAAFASMDLITREEFDVQVRVLARTREKIEALQQQIDAQSKQS